MKLSKVHEQFPAAGQNGLGEGISYGIFEIATVIGRAAKPAALALVVLLAVAITLQLTVLRTYTSYSTLQLNKSRMAILMSDQLWNRISQEPGANGLIVRRVSFVRGSGTTIGWYDVGASATSASEASALLDRAIVALAELSTPSRAEETMLRARRKSQFEAQNAIKGLLMQTIATTAVGGSFGASEATELIARLSNLSTDMEVRVARTDEELAGFQVPTDIISPPSTPNDFPENVWRNAIVAGLAGAFAVIVVALLLDAMRRRRSNETMLT